MQTVFIQKLQNLFHSTENCLEVEFNIAWPALHRSEVTNMRPAKEFPAAREHFGETSTFKKFFPV